MKSSEEKTKALRERSGTITDKNKSVEFLYVLMRDHVPAGTVEEVMCQTEGKECVYTNGFLAQYAQDVANRLNEI